MRMNNSGFTLIEALITVSIIAILVALGAPAVVSAHRNIVTGGAVKGSFFAFQQAKSHAVRGTNNIVVDINPGDNWCIGMTDQAACDCAEVNSCTVDGVESNLRAEEFPGVSLQAITFENNRVEYEPVRGMPVTGTGDFQLSDSERTAEVSLNVIGQVSICMVNGELRNYPECDA